MLILEKADMNLAEFLQNKLFARRDGCGTEDIESGPTDTPQDAPSAFRRWTSLEAFAPDPYEIVRRLCIDIGHGLGAIHHHKFSHGDLKPANILVFRPGTTGGNLRWVAKICDFGLSSGDDEPGSAGQEYRGTNGWLPPEKEINKPLLAENLRKCDVYVYGLVVWSAFFNKGWHRHSWGLDELMGDMERLPNLRPFSPFLLFGRMSLRKGIQDLIQEATKELAERNMEPWKFLYTGREQSPPPCPAAVEDHSLPENDSGSWPEAWTKRWAASQPPRLDAVRVSAAQRLAYKDLHWWATNSIEDDPNSSADSQTRVDGVARPAESTPPELLQIQNGISSRSAVSANQSPTAPFQNSSRMVSLVARDVDDWPLATTEFTTEKRKASVKEVQTNLVWLTDQHSRSPLAATSGLAQELYYHARYRSRIKPEWWSACEAPEEINILERALKLAPAIDTCTLAWLAKGEIGGWEARSLATKLCVWTDLFNASRYDESERLSVLLALIQAGTPVERELPLGTHRTQETILLSYIRRSRSAIIPVVITQLLRVFQRRPISNKITIDTEAYITGDSLRSSVRASKILLNDMLRLSQRDPPEIDPATAASRPQQITGLPPLPGEDTALLPSQDLPAGWREVNADKKRGPGRFLTKPGPGCSLFRSGEIRIGDLSANSRVVSYLALSSPTLRASGGGNGDIAHQRRDSIDARFPIYDEEWFTSEWLSSRPHNDVLGDITDPWKLQSFTVRLPTLNIMETTWFYLQWLADFIWSLVQLLGVLGGGFGMLLGLFLSLAAIPGGAIGAIYILMALCSNTPDGITWDGKECKQCPWVSVFYLGCNDKPI
ncbi:hypothetical protein C8A00DRAFT_46864 [Chaetomidium leptoderma]|uniref:Protein kinase domain-containing protein n=1 Tax=Chaetomidium leptoderma TaxID=669021 RepID=A0AAN6VDM4_9PEZI|nr:hypothetical protein C8A00DRAFT_46864 [Chaetomidium leptoderma]